MLNYSAGGRGPTDLLCNHEERMRGQTWAAAAEALLCMLDRNVQATHASTDIYCMCKGKHGACCQIGMDILKPEKFVGTFAGTRTKMHFSPVILLPRFPSFSSLLRTRVGETSHSAWSGPLGIAKAGIFQVLLR